MESIYPPERFKASEPIHLANYFAKFVPKTATLRVPSNRGSETAVIDETCAPNIKSIIGLDMNDEEEEALKNSCSLDVLICKGELRRKPIPKPQPYTLRSMILDGLPYTEKFDDLEVLRKKTKMEEVRSCEKLLIMSKENFHKPVIVEDDEKLKDLIPGGDFVIHVYIYKPFIYNYSLKNQSEKFRFSHEIIVLGNNTLTQFRDKIVCVSDAGIQAEVESINDDISHLAGAKAKYPSGCIFIDGVCYNDMRSPNSVDYSEEIIKWSQVRGVGEFKSADMNVMKFKDLSPRFGYPYVYMHQGDCEHIIVFADARILTSNDYLSSCQYPRIYAMNKNYCTLCYMCNLYSAKWLIKGYDRLPQSKTYFCSRCTETYCYKDGEKIGEFQLFPLFNKFVDPILLDN